VDLDRLETAQVDEMFEKFKDTKAIIFDVRGYPRGTVFEIAPRLTEARTPVAALFSSRLGMSEAALLGDGRESAWRIDSQRLAATGKPRYKGKTVMLIDQRAVSHAEHTGLLLEAATGTKFIGSATAGANGDVRTFSVPGGIRIAYSGVGVRHADGRQLQRIGLVPDVEVKPTIKGIREGRDEVLEKALEFLGVVLNEKLTGVGEAR
jgi:C-terminal processing protease CtpA/Prc